MDRRERRKQKKQHARQQRLKQEKRAPPRPQSGKEPTAPADVSSQPRPTPGPHAEAGAGEQTEVLDNFFQGEPAEAWLTTLLSGDDLNLIVRTLDPVYLPDELVLKASVCCEMLAAAEVIAAAIGRPSPHLPPNVAAWLLKQDALFSPGVVMLAARAVQRVGAFSELRMLWDAVHRSQAWLAGITALQRRLDGFAQN